MKTRTLFLLPAITLVGFLAIKPPAVGTTAPSGMNLQQSSADLSISSSSGSPTSVTPSEGVSESPMAQTPQPLSSGAVTAPVAPPVIAGGDDDDEDDDHDEDEDHHERRGDHDDDDDDDEDDD